jgi:hypothetical protein
MATESKKRFNLEYRMHLLTGAASFVSDHMSVLQDKIAGAIITRIRGHRRASSARENDLPPSREMLAPAKLREALFSDFEGVAQLKQRWELAADSFENWERLWRHNPALVPGRPIGWVLEAKGRVVGYLGNISQLYRYGDMMLSSVTAHGLVVEPPYRGLGVSLVAAYFRQRSVDLFISTGAIAPVGNLGRVFKSEVLPQVDYETVLFWVLQPYPFVRAVMRKLGLNPTLSRLGGMLGSLAVATDKFLRRRWPTRSSLDLRVTEVDVGEIGEDFQELWLEKVNEMPRLLAERSPATLRWHFEIPGDRGSVRVLRCTKNGNLVGYAVIRNEPADETGLRKSIIADMLAKKDDVAVMETLLAAAYAHAQLAGSHILEVLGFPPSIRHVWAQCRPYVRKYPTPIFSYKATDSNLHKAISGGMTWYASPFDGDLTLIRPSYSNCPSPPRASEILTLPTGEHVLSGDSVS